MKKYLLVLFAIAYVVNSLAGGTLEIDKLTLEGYATRGFMPVLSTDGSNTYWSPIFVSDDEENKIYRIKGINKDGIVNIAEIQYDTEYFSIRNIYQRENPDDAYGGICIRRQLNDLKEVDVDFNYLFVIGPGDDKSASDGATQLVNERGDVIYTFPLNTRDCFYNRDLFYISYNYYTGDYPDYNYTCEVINLASLLKSYSTSVESAKADAVNSKSTKTYNIQGMEVDDDAKGIIIENGAKYIKE